MLAMQYRFPLPADYDMAIIKRRISERGHLLDGFPLLEWKAYLWSERQSEDRTTANAYAPFYLWRENAGINHFLGSPGFNALCEDFGRPAIDIWSVWDYLGGNAIQTAAFLHQQRLPIRPEQSLAELQRHESALAKETAGRGAISVVTAFDPQRWCLLRVSAWASAPGAAVTEPGERYQVGYVARG